MRIPVLLFPSSSRSLRNTIFVALLSLVLIPSAFSVDDAGNKPTAQKKPGERQANKWHPSYEAVQDIEGLPRVLLLGDSVSIGYTLDVRKQLAGKANVHRPPFNCGPTERGLAGKSQAAIERWLATGGAEKKWDVIHFNWGLHDIEFIDANGKMTESSDPKDPPYHHRVTPEEYRKNLETLVARLQKTGAKLIWSSTTPVPQGAKGHRTEDVPVYNGIAGEVMKNAGGILIDDLYRFALPRLTEIQRPQNIHYTSEGYAALAQEVSRTILMALGQ